MKLLKKLLLILFDISIFPIILFYALLVPKKWKVLVWGPEPLINNKYWSSAMQKAGYTSITLMRSFSSINKKEDYDLYFDDLVPGWIRTKALRVAFGRWFAFLYILGNASIVHIPFSGGPLGSTFLWRMESYLYRWYKIKIIVIPYGGDAYLYSRIIDPCLRNAILISYPEAAKNEYKIERKVRYWTRQADIIIASAMIDGIGRWDCTTNNVLAIDCQLWVSKTNYSQYDGKNGLVKIIHTPNHRGFKGTEYLLHAIDELRSEGLKTELILLEGVLNEKVREVMQEADILAEQFIFSGYGLSAIEGMASGLPVLANLEHESYTKIFRRYGFLNECPILSTPPELIKEHLKILVTNPALRKELGQAGRKYAEKYHSYDTAQYLFSSIYDKILHEKEIDLMNLFHPLKSEFNRRKPFVHHPLINNKLPQGYVTRC